jgi:hypothetical protein
MIIDFDTYLKNDDIRTFADFVRTSVQKGPLDFKWVINLECALDEFPRERHLAPGKPAIHVFSALINDSLKFGEHEKLHYRWSVCNAVAGWAGEREGFTEQDAAGIFETLEYLRQNEKGRSIDTEKIFTKRIEVVSKIYHFSLPSLWAVYDRYSSFAMMTSVLDFRRVHPDIEERLGDLLRVAVPLTSAEFWKNKGGGNVESIASNFVRTSLLLRCIAENLNEHHVIGGKNFMSPGGRWEISQAGMALSWWIRNRTPDERPQPEPFLPPGRLTIME